MFIWAPVCCQFGSLWFFIFPVYWDLEIVAKAIAFIVKELPEPSKRTWEKAVFAFEGK